MGRKRKERRGKKRKGTTYIKKGRAEGDVACMYVHAFPDPRIRKSRDNKNYIELPPLLIQW
jgi:hypothetical protein